MGLIPVKINLGNLPSDDLSRLIRDLKKIQERYVVMSNNPSKLAYIDEIIEKLEEIDRKHSRRRATT